MSDRRAVPVLLLVAIAAAVLAFLAGTLGDDGSVATPASTVQTIEQEVELGTVDLADYCRFLGHDKTDGRSCYSATGRTPIDLGHACDWQYGEHGLTARWTDGEWTCAR